MRFVITVLAFLRGMAYVGTDELEYSPQPSALMKGAIRCGDTIICGQPDLETIKSMPGYDVSVVVNTRTQKEVTDFRQKQYDPEVVLEQLGIEYVHIPLGGAGGYSVAAVDQLHQALQGKHGRIVLF